ncbi:translation elongation factor Ts [Candidatus Babeliales bacterium]|nr:translation elongation factor Ts [Candidatus Babeliales bacterium]
MAKISMELIQQLRERTSMGMMDCKKALEETGGDIEKSVEILRKKGVKVAAKRGDNATSAGLIHAYIHPGATIGVLIELNCETDFVARNSQFLQFASDLGMHIAAINPQFLSPEDVSAEFLEKEKEIMTAQLIAEGKKPDFITKIIEGKVTKLYSEVCLLQQKFVKDDKFTVDEVLKDLVGKVGENIKIRRFSRFQIGL